MSDKTGGSFGGSTITITSAVVHAFNESHNVRHNESIPMKPLFGLYVTQTVLPTTATVALPLSSQPILAVYGVVPSASVNGIHTVIVLS